MLEAPNGCDGIGDDGCGARQCRPTAKQHTTCLNILINDDITQCVQFCAVLYSVPTQETMRYASRSRHAICLRYSMASLRCDMHRTEYDLCNGHD